MRISNSRGWALPGLILVLTVAAAAAAPAPADAATRTWDAGGANANWTTAANWQGDAAPAAGDALVFPAGVVEIPTTNDFPDGTEFSSLTFGKSYVLDGNRILLADGITNTSTQTVVIALDITLKGQLIGSNSVSIDVVAGGHVRLDGVINGAASARLHKLGGGRLLLTGVNTYNGATHVNAGVLQIEHVQSLGSVTGQTIVQDGGTLTLAIAGAGVIAEPLTLTGEGTSGASDGAITALNPTNVAGTIALTAAAASIYVDTGVTLNVPAAVSGAGGLLKDGQGTLDFTGPATNDYGGVTTVRTGTLQLSRPGAVPIPAGLIVGDSAGAIWGDVVHLTQNEQIAGPITVTSTGHLDVDTQIEVVDSLTMTGGKITSTGPGQIGLGGDVTVNAETGAVASILGQLSLGAAARTFAIGGNTLVLDIVAVVSGAPAATVIKTGTGYLRLRGANVYQGLTTVQEGRLIIADSQSLGTSGAGTMVMPAGSLDLLYSVAAEPLVAQDDGNGSTVSCVAAATLTWGGPISIGGTVGFYVPAGCTLRLDGTISGPGNLSARAFGAGVVELAAINTYTGSTTMETGGELRLGISNAIPDGSTVTINGRFNLAGHSDTVAGVNATQNSQVLLGAGTLTLAPPQGVVTACLAGIEGSGNLVKLGAGLARLSGWNTYAGQTTVAAGILLLDGRLAGPVTVTGGTLAGDGVINDTLTATGGRIAPSLGSAQGEGTGRLVTSPVTLNAGATLTIDINGQTAGDEHDQLQGSGVTLNGPALEIVASPSLQVSNLGEIVILRNILNTAIAGTFAGLAEGATLTSNGKAFRVSYHGGDGNDVSLVPAARDYYLSEGATGGFFDLDILVANPNATPAPVTFTFLRPDGSTHAEQRTVGAFARLTLNVDTIAGLTDTAVSTVVTSDTGVPLVVERTMRWDASGYGAHTEKAAGGTSPTWYFAEGSQGFFSTYLLLVNPQSTNMTATVVFLREGVAPVTRTYPVNAKSRVTVDAGADPDLVGSSFGMKVTFDAPGVAERAMYFGTDPFWKGGHESTGATAPSASWFLAEGATGSFFETFVLIANPEDTPATGTITYLPSTGVPVSKPFTVPAAGRLTINIESEDPSLANAAVATQVTANHPVIVERAQYWPDPAPLWTEAHNSFGVTNLGTKWGLAEGRQGGSAGNQTYILLANPGDTAAQVTITFLRENGAPFDKVFSVQPKSRFNVDTGPGTLVPELIDESFGALIVSDQPIAVERAMYSNAGNHVWAAGTNATATPLP
jgi:autotransporter-associated beta strand protein